jgi:hypothetical protein
VRSTVVFNFDETLAPPPRHRHATLTARRAWDDLKEIPGSVPVDPSFGYQLGIMNSPPAINHVLVWAFTQGPFGCPATQLPGETGPVTLTHSCLFWTFVNATTGRTVETTLQRIR